VVHAHLDNAIGADQAVIRANHCLAEPVSDKAVDAVGVAPLPDGLILDMDAEDEVLRAVIDLPKHPFSGLIARVESSHVDVVSAPIKQVAACNLDALQFANRATGEQGFRFLKGATKAALMVKCELNAAPLAFLCHQ